MGRTGSGGPSRPLERLPWPCQQGSDVPRPPGIAQPQVLGLWPGAAQLSPDPGPPAPAWKEEAKEDLPVGLWPAWKEEKASEPGDLRNLWLFLAWPAARRQVGAAELGRALVPRVPRQCQSPCTATGSWGRVGSGHRAVLGTWAEWHRAVLSLGVQAGSVPAGQGWGLQVPAH